MRRAAITMLAFLIAAGSALAVDIGRAEGTLVIDGTKIDLSYAYAIGHHKNQITNRSDNTLIILTDKPLTDATNLHDFEATLPEGINGVMICVDLDKHVTHVAVQHPSGMYDGGFFEGIENYEFRPRKSDEGLSGIVTSRRIKTNTMTFSYDVTFSAVVR